MDPVQKKFQQHALKLQQVIERPGGNHGEDTAYVGFTHNGVDYTVSVTSNRKILSASLWKQKVCQVTVMGKDGILLFGDAPES
ncbi:MAG: hypothetical protein OEZ68_19370 [Gammaproteobacteria bacterium]|nr:hypothetical protein [Gammaproteobacteria bacterium]MDH5802970.1 hypothetical protein [Gammaproteobacteria bacterium]